ncbi:MAG: prepilin peptidase [Chloroflexi bacterium]|nr:prepilin peptidase [Chloroflexota bacterium]
MSAWSPVPTLFWILSFASLAICDACWRRIPDLVVLPLLIVSLLFAASSGVRSVLETTLTGASTAVLFAILRWLSLHFAEHEAIGKGDVKLFALIGTLMGWTGLLLALLLGLTLLVLITLPLVALRRLALQSAVPLGAAIAAATAIIIGTEHALAQQLLLLLRYP